MIFFKIVVYLVYNSTGIQRRKIMILEQIDENLLKIANESDVVLKTFMKRLMMFVSITQTEFFLHLLRIMSAIMILRT